MLGIEAVFDELDNRQKDLRIAAPHESAVDVRGGGQPRAPGQFARLTCKDNHRQVGPDFFDRFGESGQIPLSQAGHGYDQVDRLGSDKLDRLGRGGHAGYAGGMTQAQVQILAGDQLAE